MTGIYAMYFTGAVGSGFAVFVMKNGMIAGADASGGILDGTYRDVDGGMVEISISLTIPAGAMLVTGPVAGQDSMTQEIEAKLPTNFADGNAYPVQTPTGPVNVIFKRLRDLP